MARPIKRSSEGLALATAASALPFPPAVGCAGIVPDSWSVGAQRLGVAAEFDLEVWSTATVNLTAAELFAAVPRALVKADVTFTGEADDDTLTAASHGLLNGDGPFQVSNAGGALPGGLAAATDYWIIYGSANTFKLAASFADALAGTAIPLSTDGTGTHTLSDTADTERLTWHSRGLLGNAADGAVALTAQRAYTARCLHSSEAVAYAVTATLSAATVSIRAVPVIEIA